MRRIQAAVVVTTLVLVGGKRAKPGELAEAWTPPVATSDLVLRSTFDADPSMLLGRFVPDGAEPDDGTAMVTECSRYVTARAVDAGGSYDLLVQVSAKAAAALGIPPVMAGGSASQHQALRVQYQLDEKLVYEVADAAGFQSCCKRGPGLCTGRFVSEFVSGAGTVSYAVGQEGKLAVGAGTAGLQAKNGYLWQQATTLDGMYFAFKTATTPGFDSEPPLPTGSCADVTWDDVVPRSTEGKWFVGVSLRADAEVDARKLARRNAQEQVIEQCAGVDLQCGEETTSEGRSSAGASSVSTTTSGACQVMSGGQIRNLEHRATCTDHTPTPTHRSEWLVKEAYFLPGGCP